MLAVPVAVLVVWFATSAVKGQIQGCYSNGRNYSFGEIRYLTIDQNCSTIRCDYGYWTTLKHGCNVEGECYPEGDTIMKNCSVLTCPKFLNTDKIPSQAFIMQHGCRVERTCYQVGYNRLKNGSVLACLEFSNTDKIRMQAFIKQTECNVEGTSYPVGDTYLKNCSVLTCHENTENTPSQAVIKQTGCLWNNEPTCYPEGETFVRYCRAYTCTRNNTLALEFRYHSNKCCYWDGMNSTFEEIHPHPVDQNCSAWRCDEYGNWTNHKRGCQVGDQCLPEWHVHYTNSCERHVCVRKTAYIMVLEFQKERSCCIRGVKYEHEQIFSLPGEFACLKHKCFLGDVQPQDEGGCCSRGAKYAHGQIFSHPGESRCIEYRCSQGDVNLYEHGCEDFVGSCVPVGKFTVKDCNRYYCIEDDDTIPRLYKRAKNCADVNGKCHPYGTAGIRGRDRNGNITYGCTCSEEAEGLEC